jgi:acetyltransferase-like isoleucine patch superfamily enzyme
MRRVIALIAFLAPPFLKKPLLVWFLGARIGRGARLGWFTFIQCRRFEMGDYSELRSCTVIRCDGDIRIGSYSVVSNFVLVYGSAGLYVGDHCYIGPMSLLNADEDIRIGRLSAIGPRSMVFTHGSFLPVTEGYWSKLAGVTIGDNAWIAAGVFIHPGATVGSNVFVNSRSVITGDIPSDRIVEGFPAKPIGEMQKLRKRVTPKRLDALAEQMLRQFAEIVLRRKMALPIKSLTAKRLSFSYKSRDYEIVCIPSEGTIPEDLNRVGAHLLFLSSRPGWTPPAEVRNAVVFDINKMQTAPLHDPMQRELWQFFRMYLGVTFEFR